MKILLTKIIFFQIFCLLTANVVWGLNIQSAQLTDQFGTLTMINESTEWIIFSEDKQVSDKINQALDELKISDIGALKGAYVAEISKMPSLVSKMFALPKMREYKFKLLLDKKGDMTKSWPREKSKATLMKLKNLEIIELKFAATTDEIKIFLKEKIN